MSRSEMKKAVIAIVLSAAVLTAWGGNPLPGKALAEAELDIRRDGTLDFFDPDRGILKSIAIEIAEKLEDQIRGLMGRRRLDDTVGMLFLYDKAGIRRFWMRNTPRSLDMIFVSDHGEVINIERETEPMSLKTYSSSGPAAYVVEVVAGFCNRYGIRPGTRIEWHRN